MAFIKSAVTRSPGLSGWNLPLIEIILTDSPHIHKGAKMRGTYADISGGDYEGRTACRNPASFAVALYCGIGSSSLNALVKALDRLHMVRGWNSSCTG